MTNLFNLFGPLAQFELVQRPVTCSYNVLRLALGSSELDELLVFMTITLFLFQLFNFNNRTSRAGNVLSIGYENIVKNIIQKKSYNYTDLLSVFFSIIFVCNLSGLIPYSQTVTAQMVFALVLSLITMLTVWFHALHSNKNNMLNHFLPNGAPLVITPFIITIEIISNVSRIISLAVRLFANMTSGHALLKILASFGLGTLVLPGVWKILIVFPTLVIFIITMLEVIIAFLQTYVFVTLALIYVSEQE
jgi:F-type H+-transporting ATPase subunit a